MEKMSFAAACVKHGLKLPGESVGAFGAEIKRLTPEDHTWFKAEFAKIGVEIVRPQGIA